MKEIICDISNRLLNGIKTKYQSPYEKPSEIKLFWFYQKYLLFSVTNAKGIFGKKKSIKYLLSEMIKLKLMPFEILEIYNSNVDVIEALIKNSCALFDFDENELSDFYESILNIELTISKDYVSLQAGKSSKDAAGSYYTPKDLAYTAVKEAMNRYVDFTDISDYSIADLSCGCGEFFEACYSILKEEKNIDSEKIIPMFRGIDVDPIALQICICRLLKKAPQSEWESIIGHFKLGNPLIYTQAQVDNYEKIKMFALGRLYASQMGIDIVNDEAFRSIDLVVGNPPWEKIRFEERRFFAHSCPEIAVITKKDSRQKAIKALENSWTDLYSWSREVQSDYDLMTAKKYAHPLLRLSVCGELNTYALFTELASNMLSDNGTLSLILKSSIVSSPANKALFSFYLNNGYIRAVDLFENKNRIFNIDSRERFCVLTLSKKVKNSFDFSAGLKTIEDYFSKKSITVSSQDIKLINPATEMIPNVNDTRHISFLIDAHRRLPVFESVFPNCHFGRLIHLTAHAEYIDRKETYENLPIYEGKFLEQYNARFSTFEGVPEEKKYSAKASAKKYPELVANPPFPQSRFYVRKSLWEKYAKQYPLRYSLCWRSLTSPTNYRTMIAMILRTQPTCQSIQMLQMTDNQELVLLLGLFNSKPFDYFVRLKMPGIDLTQSVVKQIPVPTVESLEQSIVFHGRYCSIKKHILSYVIYLLSKESTLAELVKEFSEYVYDIKDNTTELKARQYLDELFFCAYGFSDVEHQYILNSFPTKNSGTSID